MLTTILEHVAEMLLYGNIAEYALHRWAEHGPLWMIHQRHHEDPERPSLLHHTPKGIIGVAALIALSTFLFRSFGWQLALGTFLFYYVVILEGGHYLCHRFHFKFHMQHHADLEDGNYNVWLPIGDFIFGTIIRKKKT